MIVTTLGQTLVLVGLSIIGLLINRFLFLERSLACLLTGFVVGLSLGYLDFDTGLRADNLKDLVFFLILPVLIFEAAWHLKPSNLKKWIVPVLLLSTLGVLITMFLSAALMYIGIGHSTGFPWAAALLTGAILASTDPMAVIAKLREGKVNGAESGDVEGAEDLTTLLEGESLFNDASAIVLFSIVIGLATQSVNHEGSYFSYFGIVFFGGLVVGLVVGLLAAITVLLLKNSVAARYILVFTAFTSFYIAEQVLNVSGILSVMMAAIVCRASLREVDSIVAQGVSETWEWLGLFLSCLLFVIMGLVIELNMFKHQWLAMIIAVFATLVARFLMIKSVTLLCRGLGKPIARGWQSLMTWGGLRGAIAIALVLSLPEALPYWWVVQSMVFGVVVFSFLIQGPALSFIIRRSLYGTSLT